MSGWGIAGAFASCILLAGAMPGAAPAIAPSARAPPCRRARPRRAPAIAQSAPALPCRLGFTSIKMTALASGHHVVAVTLNGKPGIFMVDTGAGATVIHTP